MRLHILTLTIATALGPSLAHAAPLTPWGTAVSPGDAAFTQYGFADATGVSGSSYINPGVADRVDLIAGASFGFTEGAGWAGPVELMPRFFVTDSIGIVARFGSTDTPGAVEVGPEIHAAWSTDRVAFTTNVGWRPMVGPAGGAGSAFAVLAPEVLLSERFTTFVEVNGGLDLASSGLDLSIVPGVSAAFGNHGLSFGLAIPTSDPSAVVAGAWYGFAWGS